MTTSQQAIDYLRLWSEDLIMKGFRDVAIVEERFTYIRAVRPDGKRMRGFAAFTPADLDIKLRQAIEDACDERCVAFLVTPYNMYESAEGALKTWGMSSRVHLEAVF